MSLTTRPAPMDVFKTFPDLHALMRPALRLHPRRASKLPTASSKMGGSFLNPRGLPWPEKDGVEYIPVLQILKRDLAAFEEQSDSIFPFYGESECFQLLWILGTMPDRNEIMRQLHSTGAIDASKTNWSFEDTDPKILIRWLDASALRNSRGHRVPWRETRNSGGDFFPHECKLTPELIRDYPNRWALSDYFQDLLLAHPVYMRLAAEQGMNDNPLGYYHTFIGAAPGTKLGGHPSWIQCPAWPLSDQGLVMEHLLTIASCEWDAGDHERWKPIEDGDPHIPDGPNDDPGIMIGDVGDAYVFVARKEKDWPVKIETQCS